VPKIASLLLVLCARRRGYYRHLGLVFFVTLLIIMSNILLRSFLLDAQCDKLAEVAVCRLLRQSMDTTVEERGPRPTGTCGRSV